MFENLQSFVDKEVYSDLEISQGNKILLYINSCLSGRQYLSNILLDEKLINIVPVSVYEMLIQFKPSQKLYDLETHITYPYLKLLLNFDCTQFLNVISTCKDAPVFTMSEQIDSKKNGISIQNSFIFFLLIIILSFLWNV